MNQLDNSFKVELKPKHLIFDSIEKGKKKKYCQILTIVFIPIWETSPHLL